MPELRATNLGAVESHKPWHDYTYGTSKASLRPVVLDENYDLIETGIHVSPKRLRTVADPDVRALATFPETPKPKKRKKARRTHHDSCDCHPDSGVTMPDDKPENDETGLPWWMDEQLLTLRNEAMLRELLDTSQ